MEPAIYKGNNALGVKIDTLDINFLKAQLSLDRNLIKMEWFITDLIP